MDSEFSTALSQIYKATSPRVREMIEAGEFARFSQSLALHAELAPIVATQVENEVLLMLLGATEPEELLDYLHDIEGLTEEQIDIVMERLSEEILAPMLLEAQQGAKASGQAIVDLPEELPAGPVARPVITINRLQETLPAIPSPAKPVVPMKLKPGAPKMDIHPVEKHLELPPHEKAKTFITLTAPKPRPYVPPPAPMRTMKSDVVVNKQRGTIPSQPPRSAVPTVSAQFPKPTTPPASKAPQKPGDPYREPID